MKKRLVSLILVLVFSLGLLPTQVLAAVGNLTVAPANTVTYLSAELTGRANIRYQNSHPAGEYHFLYNNYLCLMIGPWGQMSTMPTRQVMDVLTALGGRASGNSMLTAVASAFPVTQIQSFEMIRSDGTTAYLPYQSTIHPWGGQTLQTTYALGSTTATVNYDLVRLQGGGAAGRIEDEGGMTWAVRSRVVYDGKLYSDVVLHTDHLDFARQRWLESTRGEVIVRRSLGGSKGANLQDEVLLTNASLERQWVGNPNSTSVGAITELCSESFLWANPFIALGRLDTLAVNGHTDASYGFEVEYQANSTSVTKTDGAEIASNFNGWTNTGTRGMLPFHTASSYLKTTDQTARGTAAALWGYRELYTPREQLPEAPLVEKTGTKVGQSSLDTATFVNLGLNTDTTSLLRQANSTASPYGNGNASLMTRHELLLGKQHNYTALMNLDFNIIQAWDVAASAGGNSWTQNDDTGLAAQFFDQLAILAPKSQLSMITNSDKLPVYPMASADAYRTVTLDPFGSGRPAYVATASAKFVGSGSSKRTNLTLRVDRQLAPNDSEKAVRGSRGVEISLGTLPFETFPENVGAWMSMAAGNFDGDSLGTEELAVYHAKSGQIVIYAVEENGSALSLRQLTSRQISTPKSSYSGYSGAYVFDFPSVDLEAVQQPGDYADDLCYTVSYSLYGDLVDYAAQNKTPEEASTKVYFWVDPVTANRTNGPFTMVFRWKEDYGIQESMVELVEILRETMHFGGAGAGDINGDGSQEVVVAGYKRVMPYYVGPGNMAGILDWHLSTDELLVTYFTYDAESGSYARVDQGGSWVSMKKDDYSGATNVGAGVRNGTGGRDLTHAPLSVTCFAERGAEYAESVFMGGMVCRLGRADSPSGHAPNRNLETVTFPAGALEPLYAIPAERFHERFNFGVSNRLFTDSMAANLEGDMTGREQLVFSYLAKRKDETKYSAVVGIIGQKKAGDQDGVCNTSNEKKNHLGDGLRFWYSVEYNNHATAPALLGIADTDADSLVMRRSNKANEYYFSDPRIMAVLEAAPFFDDLEYSDNGETIIEQSEGRSDETEHGLTVGLAVQGGYANELAGNGVTVKLGLSGEFSNTWGDSVSKSYSMSFSAGDKHCVALVMVPYVRYHYEVFDPVRGVWDPQIIDAPQPPRASIITVEKYDQVAAIEGWEAIQGNVLHSTPGDPASYEKKTGDLTDFDGGRAVNAQTYDDFLRVGVGSSSSALQSISGEKSSFVSRGWSVTQTLDVEAKLGGVVFGMSQSAGYTGAATHSNFTGYNYVGEVLSLPEDAEGYTFLWRFGAWKETLATGSGERDIQDFVVLGYLVKDVVRPVKQQQQVIVREAQSELLHVKAPGVNALALSWRNARSEALTGLNVAGYEVYRYRHTVPFPVATVRKSEAEDGWFTFVDEFVDPFQDYQYVVRPYATLRGQMILGDYSEPVQASTLSAEENIPKVKVTVTDGSGSQLLTAQATPATGGGVSDLVYQWQQYRPEEGGWQDLPATVGRTATLVISGDADPAEYRCRLSQRVGNEIYSVYSNKLPDTRYVFVAAISDALVDETGQMQVRYTVVREDGAVETLPLTDERYNLNYVYAVTRNGDALTLTTDQHTHQRSVVTGVENGAIHLNGGDEYRGLGGATLALPESEAVWNVVKPTAPVAAEPEEKSQIAYVSEEDGGLRAAFFFKTNAVWVAPAVDRSESVAVAVGGDATLTLVHEDEDLTYRLVQPGESFDDTFLAEDEPLTVAVGASVSLYVPKELSYTVKLNSVPLSYQQVNEGSYENLKKYTFTMPAGGASLAIGREE